MNLTDIITAERTRIGSDVSSKKRALEELSAILAQSTPHLNDSDVFACLTAREKLGSTGLGDGVAIPHGRLKGLDECVGALLRLPSDGVDFEAADDKPVDILFGLLVPEESTETHLEILRGLAETLTRDDQLARLRRAGDGQALYTALVEHDPIAKTG